MTRNSTKNRRQQSRRILTPAPLALNAFELDFDRPLSIPVVLYEVVPTVTDDGRTKAQGKAGNAIWRHRSAHRDRCSGSGFIVEIDAEAVAVSQNWDLPSGEAEGFTITRKTAFTATSNSGRHQRVIVAILRDAIKKHFKDADTKSLGVLWRDYADYCQMPSSELGGPFSFCRKFRVQPRFLAGNRLVVQIAISTVTLDSQPLSTYYERGKCETLAGLIDAASTTTRNGERAKIRVWYDLRPNGRTDAKVVDLKIPDDLLAHAELPASKQRALAESCVDCIDYPDKHLSIPLAHLRFLHGSWNTRDHHKNTILSPDRRAILRAKAADALDGFAVHGCAARVASEPVSTSSFRTLNILPPSIRVRNEWEQSRIIERPREFCADSLLRRARQRKVAVGRFGFLRSAPIKPLLAWPWTVMAGREKKKIVEQSLVDSMRRTLNDRFDERRINAALDSYRYSDVDDLRQYIQSHEYDALFAVLPEPSDRAYQKDDTHELIKQRVGVPSQCIHYDNTLSDAIALKSHETFTERDQKEYRRSRLVYDLCIDNLLVKCGWIPYISSEPFRFNVHVGIDVGGKNNDTVVVSVCHGLANPNGEIVFKVQRVSVDVSQSEPIPTDALALGLRQAFDCVRSDLEEAGQPTNFEDVLFFRDGAMLGKNDEWNEKDGLNRLRDGLKSDGLIDGSGVWAVAEAHKRGKLWRVEGVRNREHENPVVGQCVIGFEREDEAIVCTTGQPYLTQGTANPTIVRVHTIHGDVDMDSVLVDYVWEADMGFTKMDMAHSLPWILQIADSGALQRSRAYESTGITV